MEQNEIYELLSAGESISLEFMDERVRPESLAREMVSMANTLGGVILLGVQDDGSVSGLSGQKQWEEWVHNIAGTF
jgi:ATP-dependent DNA helicase RecG